METDFREILGIPNSLKEYLQVTKLDSRQKKAIKNIKYCTEDQWQFVNSWYDERSESARQFVMDPPELYKTIREESMKNVYDEGFVGFGESAKSFLKDVRFCGKKFLSKVTFYYMVKFLEEAVVEVEGTEEDVERITSELKNMRIVLNV